MYDLFIGIDLHKHQFTCYFFNSEKEKGFWKRFSTDQDGYKGFFRVLELLHSYGYSPIVAVESTGNTRYFKNIVEKQGIPVKIVNTMKFKVVNESVNKTDKRDAKVIAEFLSKDMLPEVQLCSENSEQLKRLLTTRKALVETRVKLKNQIHGILLGIGINSKKGQLNSKKGRTAVIESLKDSIQHTIVETVIGSIETLEEQIKKIEVLLQELTKNDEVVEILESIPGTGKICAITVRAHIDDIGRFEKHNKLSSYAGLVPWVQCSDTKEYYGHITKRGSTELRTVLIQMVLGMIRCKSEKDNQLMKKYRYLKKQKGSGKALVALARKMTKIIWVLLTKKQQFDSSKLFAKQGWIGVNENELRA